MKKLIFAILALVLVFAFVACSCEDDPVTPTPATPAPPTAELPPTDEPSTPTDEPTTPTEVDPVIEPIARPAGLIYSFATDAGLQSLDVGRRGGGDILEDSPYIINAGSPTFNIIETPSGGKGIRVTDREETWHAFDINTAEFDWDLDNNEYIMTVTGSVPGGGTARIGGADSPWGTFVEVETDAEGNFFMTLVLDTEMVESAGSRSWFRIAAAADADDMGNYEVHDISVARYIARPAGVVYSLSTDGLIQSMAVGTSSDRDINDTVLTSPSLTNAGDPRFGIVEGPHGNAIEVRNRMESWHAVDFIIDSVPIDIANNNYTLTVTGKVDGADVFQIGGADSPWAGLSRADTDADGNFTVSLTLTSEDDIDAAGSRRWFRLAAVESTHGDHNHYVINEITLRRN